MNRQRKSLFLSLLIHGVLLTSLYAVSSSSAWQSAPVVIDFSVSSGAGPESGSGARPAGCGAPRAVPRPHSSQPLPRVTRLPAQVPTPRAALKTTVEQNGPAAIVAPPKREAVVAARAEIPGPVTAGNGQPPSGQGGSGGSGSGKGSGSGGGGNGNSGGSGVGGGAGGMSAEQLRNRYLKEHFTYIRDLIQRNISYPARARKFGWAGRVVVCFIVHESGRVSNERVVNSSGYELLDSNVISTIREVSPFPQPPVKAELRIPIVYSLE